MSNKDPETQLAEIFHRELLWRIRRNDDPIDALCDIGKASVDLQERMGNNRKPSEFGHLHDQILCFGKGTKFFDLRLQNIAGRIIHQSKPCFLLPGKMKGKLFLYPGNCESPTYISFGQQGENFLI